MKTLLRTATALLICNMTSAYADEDFTINAEVSISQDDNLNRSLARDAEIQDTFTTASIGLQQSHGLSNIDYISYGAHLKYDHFNEVSGLNNAEASVSGKYNIKPVPGFNKPVYIISADAGVIDSATDIRDTTFFNIGLTLSSWITSTISARTGAAYRIKESDSRVYDARDTRFFINADLSLGTRSTAYATFNYIRGDVVSTLDNTAPEVLEVFNLANQIEPDPTFAADQIAYRFDSKTRFLVIGWNYALAQKHSLDLSLRNLHSRAGSGVDYDTTQMSLSYLLSF